MCFWRAACAPVAVTSLHQGIEWMVETQEIIIAPGKSFGGYWRELIAYRSLFYFLVWRDVLVRYKQTVLGVLWCLLRPLVTMVVFTIVFGRLAAFPSEGGAPYALLVFSALLPWQLFSGAVSDGSNSLIGNASLIAKVYFPRLLIPISALLVSMVDFIVALVLLAGLMLWFGHLPGWRLLALPAFLGLALLFAISIGLWTSALNVKYRDFRYIVPFALQLGLYLSPVGFSSRIIPSEWLWLYSLNPMVGVIDGFRWALLADAPALYLPGLVNATILTLLIGISGLIYFRRTERRFADVI
jgi:lipopolysaccharide transport system permease protein